MGAYLSTPLTDKESTDEANECLSCGASQMQGWRMSQEDAHICSLDFDKSISLFAVFDGHGGPEVAQYCSKKLPEFLKNTDAYKAAEYEKALKDAFIGFDATLVDEGVIEELKKFMPADKLDGGTDSEEEGDDEDYDDLTELRQESRMPIEELLEKLKDGKNIPLAKLKQGESSGLKPISPCLRGATSRRKIGVSPDEKEEEAVSSSSASATVESCQTTSEAGSSSAAGSSSTAGCSSAASCGTPHAGSSANDGPSSSTGGGSSKSFIVEKAACDSPDSSSTIQKSSDSAIDVSPAAGSSSGVSKTVAPSAANGIGNECGSSSGSSKNEGVSSSSIAENGIPKTRNKISSTGILPSLIDSDDSDSQTSDSSYAEERNEHKSGTEDEMDSDEDEDDTEDEDDEGEVELADDDDDEQFLSNMLEGPGSSSGCTAVLALLAGNELYVANAGDSRCVVCRNGAAMDMSLDHKPEDTEELERIQKAGGRVTMDGRVNGGLNLSRAIGDHAYKTNKDLKAEEQMISALPDIKRATITAEDEFMILACDGIWNSLSSEEVVEFVRSRILKGETKMSAICEELFTACLAPNTVGDGTGCDNMTAVIVQFKPLLASVPKTSSDNKNAMDVTTSSTTASKKRSASPTKLEGESESHKRSKTDDQKDAESVVSTAETTSA